MNQHSKSIKNKELKIIYKIFIFIIEKKREKDLIGRFIGVRLFKKVF